MRLPSVLRLPTASDLLPGNGQRAEAAPVASPAPANDAADANGHESDGEGDGAFHSPRSRDDIASSDGSSVTSPNTNGKQPRAKTSSGSSSKDDSQWKKGLRGYLENSSYGKFLKAMESTGLLDKAPQGLPSIVAIGEESSGKSATLERITMLPIFPKDHRYGTKMPIRVKMFHDSVGPKRCWISFPAGLGVTLEGSPKDEAYTYPIDLDSDPNPSATVLKVMNTIHDQWAKKQGGEEVVVPHELTVYIYSSDVPTMEIIDLPGIRETPEHMKVATRQLAMDYAQKPENVVLCVVPATQARLVSSQAVGIIEQLGRFDRTVCVLTKCDEVLVTKAAQRQLLVGRVTREGPNYQAECNIAHIIGVVNRDISEEGNGHKKEMDLMLKSLSNERDWFSKWIPELDVEHQVTIHSLIRALDAITHQHIKDSWIPDAMKLMIDEKVAKSEELAALGADACAAPGDEVSVQFKKLIMNFVAEAEAAIDKDIISPLLGSAPTSTDIRMRSFADMRKRAQYDLIESSSAFAVSQMAATLDIVVNKLEHRLQTVDPPQSRLEKVKGLIPGFMSWLTNVTRPTITSELSDEHAIALFNWGRYPRLRDELIGMIRSQVVTNWESDVRSEVACYVSERQGRNPGVQTWCESFNKDMQHDMTSIILERLFVPVLDVDALTKLVWGRDDKSSLLAERLDYREHREKVTGMIKSLDRSVRQLEEVKGMM